MPRTRVYADTSVFGGCFDEEFRAESLEFFRLVAEGELRLVVSDTTLAELQRAPEQVRGVLAGIPVDQVELVEVGAEEESLRDAYVEAGVVGAASRNDAEHIAAATVARVDVIVSWNFKHIVHYQKIRGFNGVNLLRGYPPVAIFSPLEVV